jgi:hypothetical protein
MGCRHAVLTDGSPSCGSLSIYDGRFAGQKRTGAGVTAALLRASGIEIFTEDAIDELDHLLLSAQGAHGLRHAGVDKEYPGREKASDHAPT